MQIKVEAVTKEPRVFNNQVQWGVKLPDGNWVTLYREQKPNKGDTFDVNITERTGKDGRKYKDAFPVMPPLAPTPPIAAPDKKITWDDYRELMKAAHNVALVLEPDLPASAEESEHGEKYIDRSRARAAIMNTTLIAFADKKFIVPKDEDDYIPPPTDDDVPF